MSLTANETTAPAPAAVLTVTPPPASPRRWVRHIHGGGATVVTCPSWCTATHTNDQGKMLDDLSHGGAAVAMRVATRVNGAPDPVAWPVLSATLTQWPHLDDADGREPYVSFEPSPDDPIEMGPDRLAAMIAQIREHADRLDQVHAQLVAAVAEYQATLI